MGAAIGDVQMILRKTVLLTIVAVTLCTAGTFGLPLGAAEVASLAGPAVLSVRPAGAVAWATLDEGTPIHPNRDYTFTNVPAFLRGMQFTSHMHNGPKTMYLTGEKAGAVYLCIQSPATPTDLELMGQWQACGKMDTVIGGKSYPWGIWQAEVKEGWLMTVPAPDRWGIAVAVKAIKGLKPATRAVPAKRKAQSKGRTEAPTDEYGWLASDIKNRSWFSKVSSQALAKEALILESDRDPLDVVLRRTEALAGHIASMAGAPKETIATLTGELKTLRAAAAKADVGNAVARRELFDTVCTLRRKIAFANPLLNFDKVLFITRNDPGGPFHMCDQFYGCNAKPGGGLYVLSDAFGPKAKVTNLLDNAVVANGRLKGLKLTGGSFLSPELSYDGKTILFAWTQAKAKSTYMWSPTYSYHIFKCNADGSELTQLTDGDTNDFDPCFLPSGRVAFISERRGGYLRCGRVCPVYAMFSMKADGSDIIPLSYHETHEWQPSVDNAGMIVYTRWDYVDRDTNIAHHIWASYPDGRDPRSFHGNYPVVRNNRPWMEMEIRAIPDSHRYVAVAGAHHGNSIGSLVLINQRVEDDNAMSQLKRLTPEAPFPESEGNTRTSMRYGTPWPLSEAFYLCIHDPAARNRGVYLIDKFGNRELLYRDASVPCLSPIPLRPRTRPPVIPDQTVQTARAIKLADGKIPPATIAVMNIYDSDFAWPKDAKVTAMRIIQVLPKSTAPPNTPRIGVANQTNARAVLGTVPVEADGSVYFEVPPAVPIYFQALDSRGLAVQSMRSATYVHLGESLTCRGCHEPKLASPSSKAPARPVAMTRAPSKIRPDVDGTNPFSYPRLVQGVLDRNCVACHSKPANRKKAPDLASTLTRTNGWTQSYVSLASKHGFYFHVSNGSIKQGVHGGSRTIAGKFGAMASKLYPMLTTGSHKDRIKKMSDEDLRRIALWLDCNSEFYGAYCDTDKQARGEVVIPDLE